MAVFAITFRIGTDRKDYHEVWQSVVSAIRSEANNNETWEETSSFFILKSYKSASDLCTSIYINSSFDASEDKIVVINLSIKDYAEKGVEYPATLKSFMNAR